MSKTLRAAVLARDERLCTMCGSGETDIDDQTGRPVRLQVARIERTIGGKDQLSNLRALCSTCNQGAKNVTSEKPSAIWLLSQVRRAGRDEQATVYAWLKTKFG